jgi:hypothetical protein
MIVLITYDLKKPGKDYTHLYSALKSLYPNWWHYLESVWLLETNMSPEQVFSYLKPHIDSNDLIFVTAIKNDYSGWLPEEAWSWLRSRFSF